MTYRLTESLPYLLNRVGSRIGDLFNERLLQHELTLPMYRVLVALLQQQNQSLGGLAKMTTIELSTLSRLIKTMAARKLVTRERPTHNGRTVVINLTQEGTRLAEMLWPVAQHFDDVATQSFSDEERNWLRTALKRIYGDLDLIEGEMH